MVTVMHLLSRNSGFCFHWYSEFMIEQQNIKPNRNKYELE